MNAPNFSSFVGFPSIEAFRHVVKLVRKRCDYDGTPYPVIRFRGSVKLHGTNAGVRLQEDGTLVAQSRSRDITVEDDNAGFAAFVAQNEAVLRRVMEFEGITQDNPGVLYGEWCGGNIQKGVALNQLTKRFVAFSVRNRDGIAHFTTYHPVILADGTAEAFNSPIPEVSVDFSKPDLAAAEFERLTMETENCCPFGKAYGVEGIGEGIVWSPVYGEWGAQELGPQLWFKTKGEKHGNAAVKTTVKVRVQAERVDELNALVAEICPEWRLAQGVTELAAAGVEREKKNTGAYLKWVATDVLKEQSDMIEASGFEQGVVMGEVSKIARNFWFKEAV